MSILYRFFYRLAGWKISGQFPKGIPKYIIVVAPHSSNWDFMIGLAVRSMTGLKSNYIAKKELFRPPFGWLFRKLGGFPVERSKSAKVVDQVVDIINGQDQFVIAITPEGTRSYNPNWKTGFHFIAKKAGIPIVPTGIDYRSKTVYIHPPFEPMDTPEETIAFLKDVFKDYKGKGERD